jgi:spore coat polysaccharide biosynthesis protein SpsF
MASTLAMVDLEGWGENCPPERPIAFRQLGRLSLLESVLRRLGESTLVDRVVVSGDPRWEASVVGSHLCGAQWVPSDEQNWSKRAGGLVARYEPNWLVLVSPHCPFLDPTLLDQMVAKGLARPDLDYVGYISRHNDPEAALRLGVTAEMVHRRLLDEALQRGGESSCEPRSLCQWVQRRSEPVQLRLIPLPETLDRTDLRFCVRNSRDWDTACELLDIGGDELSWRDLVALAGSQPSARLPMQTEVAQVV